MISRRTHGLDSVPSYASGGTIKTGTFHGKSNELGHGGRAAQLKAQGVPGAVIGAIARAKGAATGGPNYHGGKKFAVGGPVQHHLKMAPHHIQTNIHGMPIHEPMSMRQMAGEKP